MLLEPIYATPFRAQIQRALDHAGNTHTIEDLYAAVASGDMQLWISADKKALMLTEMLCYPRLKAARIVITAGSLASVISLAEQVIPWAVAQGCSRLELQGRRGWLRALPKWMKWKSNAVFATADLREMLR